MNAKKTQKTWRWLRISFSLRSLLFFTFLFAAVFGSWNASAQRQRALMDKIGSISEELGLQAQFEFAETDDILEWLPSSIESDVNYWTRPESLQVRSNGDVITSELMLALAELRCLLPFANLNKLVVNDCELDRSGIDFVLGKYPTPDYLCLKGSYWSDEKVRTLAENRALVAVDFDGLRFTDNMAEVLNTIPHLQIVRWKNTWPHASLIKKLQASRFLRSVEFTISRLDQLHIDALASLEHLREIGIAKTDGLERLDWSPLANLPNFEELWIHQCNLDRAIEKELKRTLGERVRVIR